MLSFLFFSVYLFGVFFIQIGKQVETTLVRNGKESMVNIDQHYSTHFQVIESYAEILSLFKIT